MLRKTKNVTALTALVTIAACSAMAKRSPSSPADENGGSHLNTCFRDADCPGGLTCSAGVCVAADGLPPEQQNAHLFLRPATSEHFVFALSPDDSSVAVIDPVTLAIQTKPLPEEPLDLQVIPGKDSAIIVSRAGQSISYLGCDASGVCTLRTQRTARHYPAVSVSADGHWAILWTPDGIVPDQGAEGIVGIVDISALAAGTPGSITERACGRRHTNAFFRLTQGVATEAVVLGESEVAVIDLMHLATQPLPQRLTLADDYTAVATREVVVAPDGTWVLFGSLTSMNIGVFVVGMTQLQTLALVGSPSDIELSNDGKTAVAVLREVGKVVSFPLPAALTDATLVKTTDVAIPAIDCLATMIPCTASVGQVALSPDGKLAALFTNVRRTKSFASLDLTTGDVTIFDALDKLVKTVGIGPDGHSAIVLHTSEPGSTLADTYERTVAISEGYSVVDLQAGVAQLKLTDNVPPQLFVFSGDGSHAAVTLRDDTGHTYGVDSIDLQTLVTSTLNLASPPEFAGAFADTTARVWVTQKHAAGRISFVNLASSEVRTATGYTLNAGIQ